MFYRSKWIVAVTVALGLVVLIPAAQAEQPIDFTQYTSCTSTASSDDKEFTFASFECIGITRSNQENKVFENMSALVVGIVRTVGGNVTTISYAKYMDRDGDFVIIESDESGPAAQFGGTWKILYGTGKWKGIKGSGKHVHVGAGKPIKPGTRLGYDRNTGTFELPK
jgi:hypothetical protein